MLSPKTKAAMAAFVAGLSTAGPVQISGDAAVTLSGSLSSSGYSKSGVSWALDRIDQARLPLDGRFERVGTGKNIRVYVLDTGIDASHPELSGRVRQGYDAYDGRIGNNQHGTAVAGLIAGRTVGVAPDAEIISVRIALSADGKNSGAEVSQIVTALRWVLADMAANSGRSVINLSLTAGGEGVKLPALESVVRDLRSAGAVIIGGAGNVDIDACAHASTRLPEIFVVGSTKIVTEFSLVRFRRVAVDTRSVFSGYGPCVDLYAPGENNIVPSSKGRHGALTTATGTSFAVPLVAGAAALLLEEDPSRSPEEIERLLTEAATVDIIKDAPVGSKLLMIKKPSL